MKPPIPADERQRLDALRRYNILDTAPEEAFDDITTLAAHICGTPVSLVSLVDSNRQWFKASVGVSVTETPRDVAFCGHGILGEGMFVVPDAEADERFTENPLVTGPPNVRFYAGMPLTSPDGYALGMLCVIDIVPRSLEPWQEESLTVLARQVMAQMELRRQNAELEQTISQLEAAQSDLQNANTQLAELATRDGLTGLTNHRVFQDELRLEFSRSTRYRTELSLIMLDVDHFKGFNDSFGHPEGDKVLRRVAEILATEVREADVAARYGGEEFGIILPNTPKLGALELAERLRVAVEMEPWERRRVTVSVGVATRTIDTVSAPALLAEADAALYTSKVSGRNVSTHLSDLAPESMPAEDVLSWQLRS